MSKRIFVLLAVLAFSTTGHLKAQSSPDAFRRIGSVNPLGLVFGVLSVEYEQVYRGSNTIGAAVSIYSPEGWSYISTDAKYRWYPERQPLRGFSLAGTGGLTHLGSDCSDVLDEYGWGDSCVDESATALSLGFGLEYQWLLGTDERLSVTLGLGGKRLFVVTGEATGADVALPYSRLSVGWAF